MKTEKYRLQLGHPFVLPVLGIILLFFTGLIAYIAFSGEVVGAADTRLVDVSVDGEARTVPTRADTVGELLARLEITLHNDDRVEPAIETPIVEDNQKIIVIRARPIAIVEGKNRQIINTAESSARTIATEAGVKLFNEDLVEFRQSQENLTGGVVAEEVFVERSVPVTANIYGAVAKYRTLSKTVQDFLDEKQINIGPGVTTQPVERNAPITAGMLISVNSPGKRTLAVTEPIDFEVELKNDPSLQAGQTRVEQAGEPGEQAIIYELTFEDGKEISRKILQSLVTKAPVNEVRVRGTNAIGNFSVSAEKASIMAQAGIAESDFFYVDYIFSNESGWRPGAISSNGCVGLGQNCPDKYGKLWLVEACPNWQSDPVCQTRRFAVYAASKGGWGKAYQFKVANGWW